MKPLILFSLLLVCSNGWACDSFEDCMENATKENCAKKLEKAFQPNDSEVLRKTSIENCVDEGKNGSDYIKAIAYKLDEINKHLIGLDSGVVNNSYKLDEISKKLDFEVSKKLDY